jgi:pyrimidine operon attenuation protein / uracil phosphoribosyltransferase
MILNKPFQSLPFIPGFLPRNTIFEQVLFPFMKQHSVVLDKWQIEQKIERIAFEILENTFENKHVFIAGISGNGYLFAERLVKKLGDISKQKFELFEITINKDKPLSTTIQLSLTDEKLKDATVILADDVINSGRTMIHAVRRLLENELAVLKVATLVNRTHRRYPVHADFVGLNIATTLKDNILVQFGENEHAYLD